MAIFKCNVCGYLHDGDDAPDKCPKCGALKDQFSKLDDAAAELVLKSRKTNDLHMELSGLLEDVQFLSEEGEKENLDPTCVQIFQRAQKDALELRQSIKSELQAHMGKGKWG